MRDNHRFLLTVFYIFCNDVYLVVLILMHLIINLFEILKDERCLDIQCGMEIVKDDNGLEVSLEDLS